MNHYSLVVAEVPPAANEVPFWLNSRGLLVGLVLMLPEPGLVCTTRFNHQRYQPIGNLCMFFGNRRRDVTCNYDRRYGVLCARKALCRARIMIQVD